MMQKRGSSGLSATLAAAGLADPDILALAQVGIVLAHCGSVITWVHMQLDVVHRVCCKCCWQSLGVYGSLQVRSSLVCGCL
jgi:hypothetical protein